MILTCRVAGVVDQNQMIEKWVQPIPLKTLVMIDQGTIPAQLFDEDLVSQPFRGTSVARVLRKP